jgi:hypothetical protein
MYQYTLQADDPANCGKGKTIRDAMNELPLLADFNTDAQDRGLQYDRCDQPRRGLRA